MRSIAGARTLDGNRDGEFRAHLPQGRSILLPLTVIEINRQKPARLIKEHRVNSRDHLPQQVVLDNLLIQDRVRLVGSTGAGPLRLSAYSRSPFIQA